MTLFNNCRRIGTTALIITLLIFLFSASSDLCAGPIGQSEVRLAVESWVRYVTADARPDAVITDMELYRVNNKPIAFVATLADSGFCICGADDRLLPVYVYSPAGEYDPEDDVCRYFFDHMTKWINISDEALERGDPNITEIMSLNAERADYWANLARGQIVRTDRGVYDGPDYVALDMTSIWHQFSPYNYFCPSLPPGSDIHCAIGCTAGAMAAIMRYWEWPETGVGTASTTYYYRWRSDWDEEALGSDPGIPVDPDWVGRLEWTSADGGKLRMNGYWDGTLYGKAQWIRRNYIYAGASNGSAYGSIEDGNYWFQINNGLSGESIKDLAIGSNRHIFAGTWTSGMYRTIDEGRNWIQINSGLTNTDVQSVILNSTDDIFVGTSGGGVFRSMDDGNNWTEINSGLTTASARNVHAMVINSAGDIFAGTGDGVYRSVNNGDSWTSASTGLPAYDMIALAVNSAGDIFVGTSGDGVYLSTDDGAGWTEINDGLTETIVVSVAVNSSGDIFAGTPGGGVFRSVDNGDNWTAVNNGLTDLTVRELSINLFDDIFAATAGGVHRSQDDGGNWSLINNGIDVSHLDILSLVTDYSWYMTALEALYNRLTQESQLFSADYGATTYQWDEIMDEHLDPPDAGDMAVATLCYHAGVSVLMGYGLKGSGAPMFSTPFVDYFRYDDDISNFVGDIGNYGSGFDNMMDEIQWLRPIEYYSWEDIHIWVIFGYNRTFLPDYVEWKMNSTNGFIYWSVFNPIYADHNFNRFIAPESVVRFVGSTSSGGGSPAEPYMNIEAAVDDYPDGCTLIFKAGSDNTFAASSLVISRPCLLKGYQSVIRKE